MNQLTLIELGQGEKGRVFGFEGGQGLINKLNAMGIRQGKEITKISDSFLGGPVTVQVDNIKVAIGHGMSAKIIMEVDK
ncbi:MAG: ferrous iron transport protein [Halanaerobiales bacterium]|nr:ferrous iron transport protein [Halanaerobiales bacterium]